MDFPVWKRAIIHIDMDAFFAAVEQRDNPSLRGKPVIVGGSPEGRGVVSTCSYEARRFGVRSAMAAAHAKKLCPSGIFLKPNFEKYSKASRDIMAILKQHTDKIEPVSLDEAYLDVTHHRLGLQDPVTVASLIKQNIHAVTHLTASAGVAAFLFIAKIASDMNKPDGLTVVYPGQEMEFLKDLSLRKIPGIGPVFEKELHACGLKTCGDVAEKSLGYLTGRFGKMGYFLFERSHGRDDREVISNWESKQYSAEETFPQDTTDLVFLKTRLRVLASEVYEGLKESGRYGKTVTVKVKYYDFELITRSKTLNRSIASSAELYELVWQLLKEKTLAGKRPVRLLGVGISKLDTVSGASREQSLFDFINQGKTV